MAPKEKAINLVEKFIPHTKVHSGELGLQDYYTAAIDCALISVDFAREFITGDLSESFDKTMYLFEIKQEIEKL